MTFTRITSNVFFPPESSMFLPQSLAHEQFQSIRKKWLHVRDHQVTDSSIRKKKEIIKKKIRFFLYFPKMCVKLMENI